jgi:tRNA(Ile2) C34 agmatinyltransferase TiaS
MKGRKDDQDLIMREYRKRQSRQIIAMTAALFFVLFAAAVYKRPDLFGSYAKETLFTVQAVIIAVFIGFTVQNWRCPSCNAFLSSDIYRRRCRRCGTRLQ